MRFSAPPTPYPLLSIARWLPGLGLLAGMGLLTPRPIETAALAAGLAGLAALSLRFTRRTETHPEADGVPDPARPALLFLSLLILYLGGRGIGDLWFFFSDWPLVTSKRGVDGGSYLLRSLALTLPLLALPRFTRFRFPPRFFAALFALFALLCGWNLWRETGFEPLYRVDHPSFQYRFHSFAETFPAPSFYDPNWNAGQPVPYLVASGVWTLGLPALPLLKLFSVDQLYTPLLAAVFLLVIPGSGYLAARLLDTPRRAAWICALLFMFPGKRYFVHALHYGTCPSILSLSLSVLGLALLWRLLSADTLRRRLIRGAALTGTLALTLCWPGALILAAPFAAALATQPRKLKPRALLWLALCGTALILLLLPLAQVPLAYSPIGAFTEPGPSAGPAEHLRTGFDRLYELVVSSHPLAVFAGLFWFLADSRPDRSRYLGAFFWACVLLAGWGEEIFPLLQSERLMIPADFIGVLLAALLLDRGLEAFDTETPRGLPGRWRLAGLRAGAAWMVALLLLGGHMGTKSYANRTEVDFQTMPEYMGDLIGLLKREVPEGARVLIAGRAVHGYGGAKVAALPLHIGREMMACDYYGFSPSLVEYQYPPRRILRQGPDAVFEFITLHNVSHVMTYHQAWKEALDRHPEYYTRLHDFDHISVYRVRHPLSDLLKGNGRVDAGFNRIGVELDAPAEEVVVRYNWDPGWSAEPPAELFPYEAGYDIRFIGIRPHGLRRIELTHRPPWK